MCAWVIGERREMGGRLSKKIRKFNARENRSNNLGEIALVRIHNNGIGIGYVEILRSERKIYE